MRKCLSITMAVLITCTSLAGCAQFNAAENKTTTYNTEAPTVQVEVDERDSSASPENYKVEDTKEVTPVVVPDKPNKKETTDAVVPSNTVVTAEPTVSDTPVPVANDVVTDTSDNTDNDTDDADDADDNTGDTGNVTLDNEDTGDTDNTVSGDENTGGDTDPVVPDDNTGTPDDEPSDGPVVPVTCDHSYDAGVVEREADCTNSGSIVYTCGKCGNTYNVQTSALGHSFTVVIMDPTCTKTGSENRVCTVCGVSEPVRVIPVTEHSYKVTEHTEATCQQKGKTVYTCSSCGQTKTESTDLKDHTFGPWKVDYEATTEKEGQRSRSCVCGLKETETIPVLPKDHTHEYVKTNTVNPTCEADGYDEYTCSCGSCYSEKIPAAGHDYKSETVPATCTVGGNTIYTCKNCNSVYTDSETPALGHKAGAWTTDRTPDCTTKGSEHTSCTRCGTVMDTRDIAATGHNWSESTVSGTCTSEGYVLATCSNCGATERRGSTGTSAHTPGDWTTDKAADCQNDGQESRRCMVCGEVIETRVIASNGEHNWQIVEITEPTNDTNGDVLYQCGGCGKKRIDVVIDLTSAAIIDSAIAQIITDDMTDAEKIHAVNYWMCNHIEYDYETYKDTYGGDPNSYTVYGAIVDGKAVCAGYAYAFGEFMNRLGIENGYALSNSMDHIWNQVKLDDGWYWIDVTWNDTANTDGYCYDNYLLHTEKRADDEVGGVVCDGEKYVDGAAMFEKYTIETSDDLTNMYLTQSERDALYFMVKTDDDFQNIYSQLSNNYKDKYGEELEVNLKQLANGEYVLCIQNTDNVRELLEESVSTMPSMVALIFDNTSDAEAALLPVDVTSVPELPTETDVAADSIIPVEPANEAALTDTGETASTENPTGDNEGIVEDGTANEEETDALTENPDNETLAEDEETADEDEETNDVSREACPSEFYLNTDEKVIKAEDTEKESDESPNQEAETLL